MLCLSEIQALGLCPNLYCYSYLIEALGSVGRTLEMLFQEMIFLGLRPSVGVFNVLFRGFLRKRLYELANKGLRVMEELGICENQETFGIFLDYYVSARRLSDSWQNIGDMKNKVFRLNSSVYSRLIELYRDNGIVGERIEMGSLVDRRIYNSIIDTLGKYGELGEALEVFAKMRNEGMVSDIVRSREAGFSEKMKYRGHKESGAIYAVLVDLYGQYGRFQGVEDCISSLRVEGVKMSSNIYSVMASSLHLIFSQSSMFRTA